MKNYLRKIMIEALKAVLPKLEERLITIIIPIIEKKIVSEIETKVIPVVNQKLDKM